MRVILGITLFFCAAVLLRAETSVEIDLQEQRAYLLQNGRPVLASPISSGRYGHLTRRLVHGPGKGDAIITRACMGKLLMRTGTPLWRTRMSTCKSRAAESLSRRRCIILCGSTAETECTPDIYQVILLRTAASGCPSNMPLRFLMPCRSGLPSLCSAGRQSTATTQANRTRAFRAVRVSAHSWARASRLHLLGVVAVNRCELPL